MTTPVPPGDREALAAAIRADHDWLDQEYETIADDIAVSILARWRLVPVDESPP